MRLRSLLRRLIAITVAVLMLPGLTEILESVEHLVHDGHLPHSEQHEVELASEDHDATLGDEHGCTPISHQCGCHVSAPAILAAATALHPRAPMPVVRRPMFDEQTPLTRANAPPTPPPIV